MNKTLVLMALVVATMLVSGCARTSRGALSSTTQINLASVPYPAAVGPARLMIQVTDSAGRPIEDAKLAIRGDMTHAGMTPVLAEVTSGEDGYYEASFEWTMAGDWIVTVDAELSDGSALRERFEINVLTVDEAVGTHDEPEG